MGGGESVSSDSVCGAEQPPPPPVAARGSIGKYLSEVPSFLRNHFLFYRFLHLQGSVFAAGWLRHIEVSQTPGHGLGLQAKVLKTLRGVLCSLGSR